PKDDAARRRYLGMACDRGAAGACLSLAKGAVGTRSPDAPGFAQRGCQMGNADACDLLAEMRFVLKEPAAGERWATGGCRMADVNSGKRLVLRDAELPAIPAPAKKELYTNACRAGHQPACKRLEKLK